MALQQARRHIEADGSRVALADLDLQVAELSLRQGHPGRARTLAERCAAVYQALQLPIPLGNAWRLALAFPDTAHPYFGASFTLSGAWGRL